MSYIIQKVAKVAGNVKKSAEPMVELALEMYIIARDFMNQIINTNFGSGKLALLGGI